MSDQIRSSLFLDFDNIFTSLFYTDRDAALNFAENPNKLLNHLETWGLPDGTVRDFIHKSAYMNTSGSVRTGKKLPDGRDELVFFSRFRPHFIRNGFSLVDCPSFTQGAKNAADIQIVVDVLQNLEGRVAYDELVLAAGDSDFVPLLRCVRTNGRRTMIISAGPTADAYSTIAHSYLPSDELIDLIRGDMPLSKPAARTVTAAGDGEKVTGLVLSEIERRLELSGGPLLLASLGQDEEFAHFNKDGRWNGHGAMTGFLRAALQQGGATHLVVEDGWVWNRETHQSPNSAHLSSQPAVEARDGIVLNAMRIAFLPRVDQENWGRVLEAFTEYAANFADDQLNLTHCTTWVRDRLVEQNVRVGRAAVNATFHAMTLGGVNLNDRPSQDEMRKAIFQNTLNAFERQSIVLSDDEEKQLREWLSE